MVKYPPRLNVFDSGRRLWGQIVETAVYSLDGCDTFADCLKFLPREFHGSGRSGVHAVNAADDDDLAKIPLVVDDSSGSVIEENRHVLKRS